MQMTMVTRRTIRLMAVGLPGRPRPMRPRLGPRLLCRPPLIRQTFPRAPLVALQVPPIAPLCRKLASLSRRLWPLHRRRKVRMVCVVVSLGFGVDGNYVDVHAHSLTHSHAHTCTHTRTLSLSLSHTLAHTLAHAHTLALAYTHNTTPSDLPPPLPNLLSVTNSKRLRRPNVRPVSVVLDIPFVEIPREFTEGVYVPRSNRISIHAVSAAVCVRLSMGCRWLLRVVGLSCRKRVSLAVVGGSPAMNLRSSPFFCLGRRNWRGERRRQRRRLVVIRVGRPLR